MTLAREAYRRAPRRCSPPTASCLDDLADNALERETLTREELDEIFAAHELHQLARRQGLRRGTGGDGTGAARVASAPP